MINKKNNDYIACLFLTLIFCFGFYLRFHCLGEWSLWIDEALTINDAINFKISIKPINYYLTKLFIEKTSVTEYNARFLPAIFGSLTVVVSYFFYKDLFEKWTAILGSLLLSISSWHIFWSQNARHYSLLSLFAILSMWLFYKFTIKHNFINFILSLIFLLLAFFTHPSSTFLIPAFVIYYLLINLKSLIQNRLDIQKYKDHIPIIVIMVLTVLFAIVFFKESLINFSKIAGKGDLLHTFFTIVFYIGPYIISIFYLSSYYYIKKFDKPAIFVILTAFIPFITLHFLSFFVNTGATYIFYTLPLYYVLVSNVTLKILKTTNKSEKVLAISIFVGLLVSIISSTFLYFNYQNGDRPKWKEATIFAKQIMSENSLLFSTAAPVVEYYFKDLPNTNNKNFNLRNTNKIKWLNYDSINSIDLVKNNIIIIANEDMIKSLPDSFLITDWLSDKMTITKVFKNHNGPKDRSVIIYSTKYSN